MIAPLSGCDKSPSADPLNTGGPQGGAGGVAHPDGEIQATRGGAASRAAVETQNGQGGFGGTLNELPQPIAPKSLGSLNAGVVDDNLGYSIFSDFREGIWLEDLAGSPLFPEEEHLKAFEQSATSAKAHERLDLTLLLDTTQSMHDDLGGLQQEFGEISEAIEATFPDADLRWSLVAIETVAMSTKLGCSISRVIVLSFVKHWKQFRPPKGRFS